MKIVEFEMEHLDKIKHRSVFNQQVDTARRLIEKHHGGGVIDMRSIVHGDEVAAVTGMSFLWERVGQVFTLTSDVVYEEPIAFHKAILGLLRYAELEYNLHRIEAHVVEHYAQGRKWLEACGFRLEGIMRKFDSEGNNHYLYARVS